MSWISKLLGNKKEESFTDTIVVDMHSHLLPGIDDGAYDLDESIRMIRSFAEMGKKKLITTPHIMGDFFKNTPAIILPKLDEVRAAIKEQNIDIELEAAAEYYLDESLFKKLEQEEELLTFGDKYLLFETSYMNETPQLNSLVFELKSRGYKPVLAHPERYVYLFNDFKKVEAIYDKGIYFQVNINSLVNYYSKQSRELAEKLIDRQMVHFVGSDCHAPKHIEAMTRALKSPYYKKLLELPILNNTLA